MVNKSSRAELMSAVGSLAKPRYFVLILHITLS